MILAFLGIVLDGLHHFLAQADAADKVITLDELLHDHGKQARFVVGLEQLLHGVADVDILPAAAVVRFEKGGKADIIDNRFPIDRELKVTKRFAGDVFDI